MTVRRWTAALLMGASALVAVSTARADDPLKIKTDKGKIEGKMSQDGQVRIFLGIPFAAPPVGPLRWEPPQPAEKWSGVKPTTEFGSRCMQYHLFQDMRFRDPGESEDCLTLNVWTPAKNKKEKLPVMVWIYGGGFVGGSTSEPRQDGEHLAQKGVIVVSMNYRMGLFGFFVSQDLAAESSHHAAGNYGLMDQTAALAWVKKNIKNFGGDPDNVTIFGESAGSFSVSAQMASPLAKNLFVHAIGESGAAFNSRSLSFKPLNVRELADAKIADAAFGTDNLTTLRGMSAQELQDKLAVYTHNGMPPFGPDVDGYFLPESVPQIYREGKQAHIPVIGGWNRDEPSALEARMPQPATMESLRQLAEKEFGPEAPNFLLNYPAGSDAEAIRSTINYAGDRFIAYSTWLWLEAQVKTGEKPVYRYHFERPSPADKYHAAGSGAFHSDEIEYVFGTLDSRVDAKWQPEDYKLSDLIETYWTNFARTGDPNGGPAPQWPQYDEKDHWQVMHLDVDPHAAPDTTRDRYLFLQSVWDKPQP